MIKHHRDCNISRSVGAGVSVAGAVLAFFTGGLSLVATGIGAGMCAGVDIADNVIGNNFCKDVKVILQERDAAAGDLKTKLQKLKEEVRKYQDKMHCTEEQAWKAIVTSVVSKLGGQLMSLGAAYLLENGGIDISVMENGGSSVTGSENKGSPARRPTGASREAASSTASVRPTGVQAATGVTTPSTPAPRVIGRSALPAADLSTASVCPAGVQAATGVTTPSSPAPRIIGRSSSFPAAASSTASVCDVGVQTATRVTPSSTVRILSKGAGIASAAADVGFMIHGWCIDHPTLEGITVTKKQVSDNIDDLKELRKNFAQHRT